MWELEFTVVSPAVVVSQPQDELRRGGSIRLHFGAVALVCCQYKNAETTRILLGGVLCVIILELVLSSLPYIFIWTLIRGIFSCQLNCDMLWDDGSWELDWGLARGSYVKMCP